mgnify:CR=1 FL=1
MVIIRLGDGTTITGLECDGDEFTTMQELKPETFTGARMRGVEITSDNPEETHPLLGVHDVLVFCGVSYNPHTQKYSLSLVKPNISKEAVMEGNIAYLAMMMGVEL